MTFDFDYAWEILPTLLEAVTVTIKATFGAMGLALVVGLILATGQLSTFAFLRVLSNAIVTFIRTTPLLVQLFVVFYLLPQYGIRLSPFVTGVLVLGIHYGSYMAEVYRAGIQSIPREQWEAARILGFTPARIWSSIILPQAVPPIIPIAANYLIAMYKDSAYLAIIAVNELLGAALAEANLTFRFLEPMILVGAIFVVVSYISSLGVRQLERRLAHA